MIRNDLKEKLGEDWRSKFSHRDCDQADYEFGEFEVSGKKIRLVLNPNTLDIMDFYYDDLPDDVWIEVDKKTLEKLSKALAKKSSKFYINRKYETKAFGRKPKKISNKLYKRVSYPLLSIMSTTVKVHRLIALIFIPNPDPKNYSIVNHKDTIKTNFKRENLEWCDAKWNAQRENTGVNNWFEFKFQAIDPNTKEVKEEWFNCSKSSFPELSNFGYKYWNKDRIYKGLLFKKINISLEKYLNKHPIDPNGWFDDKVHTFGNRLRANICGVLEIDGELRVGTLDESMLVYKLSIGNKSYQTHRLVYEIISGTVLKENLVIDHIIPVTTEDINNEFSNLRAVTRKDNMNNPLTREKYYINIFVFDKFGRFKYEFNSIKSASEYYKIGSGKIVSVAKEVHLIFDDLFFLYEKDQIDNRLKYMYYKFDSDGKILDGSWAFGNIYSTFCDYTSIKNKYLNTGMPAPDGYYYQQGTPNEMIYDTDNVNLIRKREEIRWVRNI